MDKYRLLQPILCAALFVSCIFADVRLPPNILEHPQDVVYRSDATFELTCTAEGVPEVTFEWFQNGEVLDFARPDVTPVGGDVGSIKINNAGSFIQGYYQCIASNQWGKAMSRVAVVQRALLYMDGDTSIEPYTASVGEPLKMRCETGNTFPKPNVTWSVADGTDDGTGETITLTSRIQIDLDGNLQFMNVIEDDHQNGKVYKCRMQNSYLDLIKGGSYSQLTVIPGSPAFSGPQLEFPKEEDKNKIALVGKNITVKCLFSGFPTPKVKWTKKNGQLPPGRHYITYSGTQLKIAYAEMSDEGDYQCMGSNNIDSTPVIIKIDVQSVPVFAKDESNGPELKPVNLNKTVGEAASFFCKAEAEPDAEIQWFVNGEPVRADNPGPRRTITNGGTNFTVHDICKDCGGDVSDLIVVQCNASNEHGYAYSQGYLNVLERTALILEPKDVTMEDWEDPVVFECDAESDPSTPVSIIWKHDGVQVDTNRPAYELEGKNLKILPLKEEDEEKRARLAGKYTCEANNGYVSATADAELVLPKAPVPPTVTPAGFNILDYWWVFLIIVIILLLIILCCLCYKCYQRNKGDEYLVDEKDRKNGYDPEKELADSGFHDFQRPEEAPFKGSRASLTSTIKLDTDDEASLLEYGEPDTGKFNEDGSFIGQYHDKSRRYNDSTV